MSDAIRRSFDTERGGLRLDDIRVRDPYEFEHASRRIYLLARAP